MLLSLRFTDQIAVPRYQMAARDTLPGFGEALWDFGTPGLPFVRLVVVVCPYISAHTHTSIENEVGGRLNHDDETRKAAAVLVLRSRAGWAIWMRDIAWKPTAAHAVDSVVLQHRACVRPTPHEAAAPVFLVVALTGALYSILKYDNIVSYSEYNGVGS